MQKKYLKESAKMYLRLLQQRGWHYNVGRKVGD